MYKLVLKNSNNSMKVSTSNNLMKVNTLERTFVIREVGRKGEPGEDGAGLPAGGTEGQVAYKRSSEDFDIEWRQPSLADKTHLQYFTAQDILYVTHNLNKYPSVTLVDSAGDEVVGSVDYQDVNNLTVRFRYPTSGLVSCN